jgi:DHA1 family bicyclomycin/chloramphenicol resistance-like MFS transporter
MGRLGSSSPMFGLVTATLMLSYLFGSLALNQLLKIVAIHRLVLAGALMVLIASLSLGFGLKFIGVGILEIIVPMCVWMVGFAFIMPGVTTSALALFPRNAGSASALMGALQMGMGFVGASLCSLFSDAVQAFAIVPPVMGVLAVVAYIAANRRQL